MNKVILTGRLTKDPEVRYTQSQMAVAQFTLAVSRPSKKEGQPDADFPRIIVFGKQAENCDRYLAKGRLCAVDGSIQTGSYKNKNGDTVYTTDVVANRVEFLEWGGKKAESKPDEKEQVVHEEDQFEGFAELDEDVPF